MCGLPADAIQRTAQKDGEAVQLEPKADGPLVGLVFKTRIDPFVQKLSFLRIFSGTLKKDANVPTLISPSSTCCPPIPRMISVHDAPSIGISDEIIELVRMSE